MARPFAVFETAARSILSPTSGFIAESGFTHSLTPARNCTFGCTYCYVPTMGIFGGLEPDDWRRWGQFTTFKQNAAELLRRELRPHQIIYCSPVVDPYQPAEETDPQMPAILEALIESPPKIFVIQTRGPLILRDLARISRLAARTRVRVSFSLTTDREDVRRWYEPHCAPFEERIRVMAGLGGAGIEVCAALAPLLPCHPEPFARAALGVTRHDLVGDPLHVRATKRHGATTRDQALAISRHRGWPEWHDPEFQNQVIGRIARVAELAGRRYIVGPAGYGLLAKENLR